MQCDDADVMMMQKQKQTKSNLGRNPGALQPTPLTRDLAPRSTLPSGQRRGGYTIESSRVMLIFSTPLTRGSCSRRWRCSSVEILPQNEAIRIKGKEIVHPRRCYDWRIDKREDLITQDKRRNRIEVRNKQESY